MHVRESDERLAVAFRVTWLVGFSKSVVGASSSELSDSCQRFLLRSSC